MKYLLNVTIAIILDTLRYMAENEKDPARDTQQFRSFVQRREEEEPDPTSRSGMPAGGILAVLALAAFVAILGIIMLIV